MGRARKKNHRKYWLNMLNLAKYVILCFSKCQNMSFSFLGGNIDSTVPKKAKFNFEPSRSIQTSFNLSC